MAQRTKDYVEPWIRPVVVSLIGALVLGLVAWWKSQDIDTVKTANNIASANARIDSVEKTLEQREVVIRAEIARLEREVDRLRSELRAVELEQARNHR